MGDEKSQIVPVGTPTRMLLGLVVGLGGLFFVAVGMPIFVAFGILLLAGAPAPEALHPFQAVGFALFLAVFGSELLYIAFRLFTTETFALRSEEKPLLSVTNLRIYAGILGALFVVVPAVVFFGEFGAVAGATALVMGSTIGGVLIYLAVTGRISKRPERRFLSRLTPRKRKIVLGVFIAAALYGASNTVVGLVESFSIWFKIAMHILSSQSLI